MSWSREEEEMRAAKEPYRRRAGLREYHFEYQIVRYLTEPIPAGPVLEQPDGNSLTLHRHRPGNLTAKRDLSPAPYHSGRRGHQWKRGESNSIEVVTSSRFDAELAERFEVGKDVESIHFTLVDDTAYYKRLLNEMPKLGKKARRLASTSVLATLDDLDQRHQATFPYLKERVRWDVCRAVEGLEGGPAFCASVVGDSLFLEGEPEAGWAERFGLKLKV